MAAKRRLRKSGGDDSPRVRHVVASRHVDTHEDYLVQDYLRLLRKDNETLRKELNGLKPLGFSPSGRYAFARVVAGLLLGCTLLGGGVWWTYASNAAAFREGVREGWVAAQWGM